MLLVTLYGFFMKLPSETGSQSLRGVRAAALPYDGEPVDPQVEVDQHQTANAGPQTHALQDGSLDTTVRALVPTWSLKSVTCVKNLYRIFRSFFP